MRRILVTGASGFIEIPSCKALLKSGKFVRDTVSSLHLFSKSIYIEYVSIGNLTLKTNWKNILFRIDCIIHYVGRVHITNETESDNLQFHRSKKSKSTKQLREQTAVIGIRHIIFTFPLLLKFLGCIFGKQKEINRLIRSLRINNIYTKKILNWIPPIGVEEGIKKMVQVK